ncbi:MAG TPA: DEAD/DEAH box helicase [Steroidobacteraceae bacterium]|nr:DEAD/DEAH box helicase [Steroidobacteraceae bacterium]
MSFTSLNLSPPLLRALEEKKYIEPTPIQVEAIPVILRGGDVRASAQTGSGKTAAFALPILEKLVHSYSTSNRNVEALILTPTRELAMQIGDSFREYSSFFPTPLRIVTAFGGVSINPQMMALRGGAEIIVATPGRLLDLVDHNALRLNTVKTLVLDEADKLFEYGFADELTRILTMIPPRQTLLFSATFPPVVQVLADIVLTKPTRIEIKSNSSTEPAITHRAIAADPPRRTQLLRQLIRQHNWSRVLVFVATQYSTEHVAEKLRRGGINAISLHGELTQGARTQALADFKASKVQVLVATDVAARGIDIAQMPVVVNFDLPRSAVDYTHRVGRTARAGESGTAVSFVSAETEAHFRLIEKRNGIVVPREQIPGFEVSLELPPAPAASSTSSAAAPGTGGIKGKRPSKKDKLREAAAKGTAPEKPSVWGRK